MPRTTIPIDQTIEYLQIIDKDGKCDSSLEPSLDNDTLQSMYRYMQFARKADERLLKLQRQGRVGTFALATGSEAVSLGTAFAVTRDDWYVPAYRELAGMLYRGWPFENFILYCSGHEEGNEPPQEGNNLPMSVPVASQLPVAAGIGMSLALQKSDRVVAAFFGDGATSEGDAHEAMNFASVFKAPVIFMCLNNHFAISVPLEKQMACKTIAQRAIAYGMPGIQVDGNDILAVFVAAKEAVERARNGDGPSLIEAVTYRTVAHTTADDPARYLPAEKLEEWKSLDPLIRFKAYLQNNGVLSAELEKKIDEELEREIQRSVDSAQKRIEEIERHPSRMFDSVYSDLPAPLQKQRQELERAASETNESEPPTSTAA